MNYSVPIIPNIPTSKANDQSGIVKRFLDGCRDYEPGATLEIFRGYLPLQPVEGYHTQYEGRAPVVTSYVICNDPNYGRSISIRNRVATPDDTAWIEGSTEFGHSATRLTKQDVEEG